MCARRIASRSHASQVKHPYTAVAAVMKAAHLEVGSEVDTAHRMVMSVEEEGVAGVRFTSPTFVAFPLDVR